MKPMDETRNGITEEDLIAYQMGECSRTKAWQVKRALENDPALAEEAAEIAATLRAFRAGPAPVVDAAMLERSWRAVRPSLAVLEPKRGVSARRVWAIGVGSAVAGAVLVLALMTHVRVVPEKTPGAAGAVPNGVSPGVSNAPAVAETQQEIEQLRPTMGAGLHSASTGGQYYHGRPGPITVAPEDVVATETGLAAHLDAAERLLTEVNHADGPLPPVMRGEARRLLLENAVYQQRARLEGDYAAAAVMDDLGRALTSLDADPPKSASSVDAFRLEFNVGGVLFDLRVLHDDREQAHE